MNIVIIILVIGAFIESFIRCTKGKIHAFKSGRDWKIPKVSVIKYIKERSGLI